MKRELIWSKLSGIGLEHMSLSREDDGIHADGFIRDGLGGDDIYNIDLSALKIEL